MMRNLIRTLTAAPLMFAALLVIAALVVAPAPSAAQTYSPTCPAMTDSITRLYYAYFDRSPDPSGFRHWVAVYQSGELSLAEISSDFAAAEEFGDKRLFSNRTFVNWLFSDLLGPEVDGGRRDYWVQALDGGYARGSMMLAFTESREYVTKTNTAIPLAGFLRWYPKGTHWYCDVGSVTKTVRPLVGNIWADYFFHSRGDQPDGVELWTLEGDGRRNANMNSATLQPGFTDYNWDGAFSGDGDYGHSIEVRAGPATEWIVVFYPRSLGPDRLGWQIS